MKLGTFDVRAWTWRGRQLASPVAIARRVLALPLLWAGKALMFTGAALGWGLDDAKRAWEDMPL